MSFSAAYCAMMNAHVTGEVAGLVVQRLTLPAWDEYPAVDSIGEKEC